MIGAQTFDALGQRWSLFLGNAAQCGIEEQYDRGYFAVVADAMPKVDPATAMAIAQAMSIGAALPVDIAEKATAALKGMRLSVLRDLAWHGLRRDHPAVTLDDVSAIIDDLGHEAFGEIIGKAIQAAQGKGDGEKAAPGKPPRRATQRNARTGKG